MNKLKTILNNSYNLLDKGIPILNSQCSTLHHNKGLIKREKPSKTTFDGYLCCGASCYLLSWLLEKHDIKTEVRYSKRGYGNYLEDHVFLLYNDIIIDPTYKQFFKSNISYNSNYIKYLYNDFPFYFLGNYNDLENIYKKLNNKYKKNNNDNLENNLVFWKKTKEIHNFCDLERVEKDFKY